MARRLVFSAVQLAALFFVLREFRLFGPMTLKVCAWVFALSLVLPFLSAVYRIPIFCAASLAAILQVLGLRAGLALLGLGGALVLLASAPMKPRIRVILLALVGIALAFARGGLVPLGAAGALLYPVWPILGSMFMFRLALFAYDRRNNPELAQKSAWHSLSYFFLLPNVCFPFFPVLDYVTFSRAARSRTSEELARIAQQGLWLMLLGVTHLLLYRAVRNWMVIEPPEVTSPALFARYLIAGYLLYLRISGEFHFIVGMLHLFGFELPYTHRNYFFAESFGDLARRINVYWKDFMAKIVFYPSLHWLRKRGVGTRAAVLVTVPLVAVATLLLHSYQWFWIRGGASIRATDGVFWTVLTALALLKFSSETRAQPRREDGLSAVKSALSTAGTFAAMCVLWSIWNSESLGEWLAMTGRAFGGAR
jgi:hypothetical protein